MNPADLPVAVPALLTPAQWDELLGGRRTLRLVKSEERERWKAHSRICTSCDHISAVRGSAGRSGWCITHRMMVSDTHPVLCREYQSS